MIGQEPASLRLLMDSLAGALETTLHTGRYDGEEAAAFLHNAAGAMRAGIAACAVAANCRKRERRHDAQWSLASHRRLMSPPERADRWWRSIDRDDDRPSVDERGRSGGHGSGPFGFGRRFGVSSIGGRAHISAARSMRNVARKPTPQIRLTG